MPFRSIKQRKFMFANKPKIAKRWAGKYGTKIVPTQKVKKLSNAARRLKSAL